MEASSNSIYSIGRSNYVNTDIGKADQHPDAVRLMQAQCKRDENADFATLQGRVRILPEYPDLGFQYERPVQPKAKKEPAQPQAKAKHLTAAERAVVENYELRSAAGNCELEADPTLEEVQEQQQLNGQVDSITASAKKTAGYVRNLGVALAVIGGVALVIGLFAMSGGFAHAPQFGTAWSTWATVAGGAVLLAGTGLVVRGIRDARAAEKDRKKHYEGQKAEREGRAERNRAARVAAEEREAALGAEIEAARSPSVDTVSLGSSRSASRASSTSPSPALFASGDDIEKAKLMPMKRKIAKTKSGFEIEFSSKGQLALRAVVDTKQVKGRTIIKYFDASGKKLKEQSDGQGSFGDLPLITNESLLRSLHKANDKCIEGGKSPLWKQESQEGGQGSFTEVFNFRGERLEKKELQGGMIVWRHLDLDMEIAQEAAK